MLSALWAGPRTQANKPVRMSFGFQAEDFGFELSCGYPPPGESPFWCDPEIKEESVWFGHVRKPSTLLMTRKGGITRVRDVDGHMVDYPLVLDPNESVLSQVREPHRYPELAILREEIRQWRFYHQFRTDEDSPLRSARAAVTTPILSPDGSDLAAALQTIMLSSNGDLLENSIQEAFPGRKLQIFSNDEVPFSKTPRAIELRVSLWTSGCDRAIEARELSDGTLKYLCLAACLLSPRPPGLIALNEPEGSLHPDLLRPLASLIVNASRQSQVLVCTHSAVLVDAIQEQSETQAIRLRLHQGETQIEVDDE